MTSIEKRKLWYLEEQPLMQSAFVFLKMLKTDTRETDQILGEMMVPKSALGSGKVLGVAVFRMQR